MVDQSSIRRQVPMAKGRDSIAGSPGKERRAYETTWGGQ